MKNKVRTAAELLFFILMTFASVCSATESLTATDILDRMDKAVERLNDLAATITVQTYKDGAVSLTQEMRIMLQQPDKMRLEYLAPAYLAGNVTLIVGNKMWMYIAAIDKWFEKDLSEISPAEQPWLMFRNVLRGVRSELDDYAFTRLEDEGDAYHIRGQPASDAAVYGRIDLWVAKTFVPVRRTLYDRDGNLLVDARFLDATAVAAGVTLPLRIETYGSDGKLVATIVYNKVAVNSGIPAALFTPPEESDG